MSARPPDGGCHVLKRAVALRDERQPDRADRDRPPTSRRTTRRTDRGVDSWSAAAAMQLGREVDLATPGEPG